MKSVRSITVKCLTLMVLMISCKVNYAQLSAPTVESVYGGRILDITGYPLTADSTRFFISTESANSLFYTDVYTNTTSPEGKDWKVMPGVNANSGFGSGINRIEAHTSSGNVFFIHQFGLLTSNPSSADVDTVFSGNVSEFIIDGDNLYFLDGSNLHFGTLDASANFTEDPSSPLSVSIASGRKVFYIHPLTGILYIFVEGVSPYLYKLDNPYSSASVPTTVIDITPPLTFSSVIWSTFGIGPDGRIFVFGSNGSLQYEAYSDDELGYGSFPIATGGTVGPDVAFGGDSSSYSVYTSSIYSNNKGEAGSWDSFGNIGGFETHPNDGAVFVDPINNDIILLTTDQGIGVSTDGGSTIFEIDEGVEAVRVADFDMTASKFTGWLASKSGIRKVSDYLSSPAWSNAIFPNGDGSPYYSIDMNPVDTNTIYAGNVRVYKTTDDGSTWNQVFTPENSPYNFPGFGSKCLAIEVFPYDPNIVFAGWEVAGPDKGGLFYTTDAGTNWNQILLESSSTGQDVDVTDIIFNIEGTDTVAYVSVIYDLSAPQGWSVYKLTKNGSNWSPAKDMTGSSTSTGSSIVVTIWDLELSVTKDTVYAAGTDAAVNEPHVYYKPLNTTGLWTPITSSGFSTSTSREATAITVGADTVFAAVDNEIYYYILGSSTSWSLGYTYPVGTRINVLYYDELLVGTDLGFYGHAGVLVTGIKKDELESVPEKFELMQNYPNPFNPSTTISYIIPKESDVSLKIYNILGKEVAELVNENQTAGKYSVSFDASSLASGVYFYTLKIANKSYTRKMILMK